VGAELKPTDDVILMAFLLLLSAVLVQALFYFAG
jgi:hypothetical protein